jgi:hypothetical protein
MSMFTHIIIVSRKVRVRWQCRGPQKTAFLRVIAQSPAKKPGLEDRGFNQSTKALQP